MKSPHPLLIFILLILALFAWWPYECHGADFTFQNNGSDATSSLRADNPRIAIKIVNSTSENIFVCPEGADGQRQATIANGINVSMVGVPSTYVYTYNSSFAFHGAPYTTAIAPGAAGYVWNEWTATATGSPTTPTTANLTVTIPIYVRKNSALTWDRFTTGATKSVEFVYLAGSTAAVCSPKVGSNLEWYTLNYTGAGPDSGHVSVTARSTGRMRIIIDGNAVVDTYVTAGQTINYDTDVSAPLVGKTLQIWQDGVVYATRTIENQWTGQTPEGLPDGRTVWTYAFDITADLQPEPDSQGNAPAPQTQGAAAKSDAPANTAEGQYSGRAPGAQGTDAKTNTTAPDTVKEAYEATRQAVEDALNGNAGIDGNVPDLDTTNATGSALGSAVGAGFSSLKNSAGLNTGANSFTTSTSGLVLPFILGTTVTVGVPSWAPIVYWFVTALVSFQFLVTTGRCIRKAFAA